jgi:type III pantothenate kinase
MEMNRVSGMLNEIKEKFPDINQCIISAVKQELSELVKKLGDLHIPFIRLGSSLKFPFEIQYSSPETLGNDRLAAVAGAFSLYPNKDVLVIDAGTAITYELLLREGGYIGGNISPGLNMRYKALHTYTDQLPLLTQQDKEHLIGNNTNEAITGGVQNGLIFEIEGYLTKISNKYPQLTVLLTGGDAQFFDNKLKKTIFVVPNLTLIGLNFILNYNAWAL